MSTARKRGSRAPDRPVDQGRRETLLQVARAKLAELGDFSHLCVRWHNDHIVIEHPGPREHPEDREAVLRLTPLGGFHFGLSLRRHTGRWEKLPVSGLLGAVIVDAVRMLEPWLVARALIGDTSGTDY